MPRAKREDYAGAWHHVMNRGVGRSVVFGCDDDRFIFLDCLAAGCARYGLQVHAYCLLDNHFHLLLLSEQGHLSNGMRFVVGRFTQRINYRDGRDGPLFRGRFASVLIESEAHLVRVSRYIHRNPVEAGLVRAPWDWTWSSAGAYVGVTRRPEWLRMEQILDMFMREPHAYSAFIDTDVDEGTRRSYEGAPWGQTRRV